MLRSAKAWWTIFSGGSAVKMALTAALAALIVAAMVVVPGAVAHRTTAEAAASVWLPIPGMPLAQPPQILPGPDGVVALTLVANSNRTIKVAGADLSPVTPFTFNTGLTPQATTSPPTLDGPTIHVQPGGTIEVTFLNDLNEVTNIHYHGLHVEPNGTSDNIFRTFLAAANGLPSINHSTVHVPLNQPVGTYWYHVHNLDSALQVVSGLSGLLVIDPVRAAAGAPATYPLPPPWQNVATRQLALRDVQTEGGQIVEKAICYQSTRLLDAQYEPKFTMHSNQWELWRLANIGANVYYDVGLSDGSPPVTMDGGKFYKLLPDQFHIVGEDGLPVWKTRQATTLVMPPGKRFDVLVRIPHAGTSYKLLSVPYAQQASKTALPGGGFQFEDQFLPVNKPDPTCGSDAVKTTDVLGAISVVGASGPITPAATPPTDISRADDLRRAPVAKNRKFTFQNFPNNPHAWQINNQFFAPTNMPLADPVLGTVEQWTLRNTTVSNHPFHIHIQGFQVISVDGKPYDADGHQDTVNIPREHYALVTRRRSGRTVTRRKIVPGEVVIRQRFTDYTGWFVFHCHILYHEDAGMMAIVEVRANASVVPTPPPASVLDPPNM
jgi:FtsP/CotA-like multicopper oxidase with cupredoxin domain